jgi:branched-chain amino acid transport system ATP-binding protein
MLEVRDIRSGYGDVTVLKGLDFEVGHEIFAVLGANGAGKSTLMRTIARLLPLETGSIRFNGDDVSRMPAYQLAASGVALVPQEGNVFPDLSVEENLSIGSLIGHRSKEERLDEVFELFPALRDRVRQRAGTLSGGESQMVAVGRALMQDPQIILLDEPTAGLAPIYVDGFFEKIREIHESREISVILAEQNAKKARDVSHRVMVLNLGEIYLIGDSDELLETEDLKKGYGL